MDARQKQAFVQRMAAARARKGTVTTEIIVAPRTTPARAPQQMGPPPKPAPKSLAKRVGSAAVIAAVQEGQILATGITGFVLGYAEQEAWFNDLPEAPASLPIGKVGVVAVTSYLVNRFLVKDPQIKKVLSGVTSAATAISTYNMGRGYALKSQAEKLLNTAGGDLENENAAGV